MIISSAPGTPPNQATLFVDVVSPPTVEHVNAMRPDGDICVPCSVRAVKFGSEAPVVPGAGFPSRAAMTKLPGVPVKIAVSFAVVDAPPLKLESQNICPVDAMRGVAPRPVPLAVFNVSPAPSVGTA